MEGAAGSGVSGVRFVGGLLAWGVRVGGRGGGRGGVSGGSKGDGWGERA